MSKLLCISTIGRTGAEVLLSELAKNPMMAMLPGQNFSGSDQIIYRPQNYKNLKPHDIFEKLSQHCFNRVGQKSWHGLTKHMNEQQIKKYLESDHKYEFLNNLSNDHSFFKITYNYVKSYFYAMKISKKPKYYGFLSGNIPSVLGFSELNQSKITILDWTASPALWLALISESLSFNPALSLKFWIISKISFRYFERNYNGKFISSSLDNYIENPKEVIEKIEKLLSVESKNFDKRTDKEDGFIDIDFDRLKNIEKVALDINKVLKGFCLLKLANSFSDWVDDFIDTEEGERLINRYISYWNSTSHIAFDLSSPAEDDIINLLLEKNKIQDSLTISYKLFHKEIFMTSRNFDTPISKITHSWGSLEDEIIIPCTPYYLRAVITYLNSILDSFVYDPWTYYDLRKNRLYKRILSGNHKEGFAKFGLETLRSDLEDKIDKINNNYPKTHASIRYFKK